MFVYPKVFAQSEVRTCSDLSVPGETLAHIPSTASWENVLLCAQDILLPMEHFKGPCAVPGALAESMHRLQAMSSFIPHQ